MFNGFFSFSVFLVKPSRITTYVLERFTRQTLYVWYATAQRDDDADVRFEIRHRLPIEMSKIAGCTIFNQTELV